MAEVNKEELAVIRELEKIIGKKISQVEGRELEWNNIGYQADEEGRIAELSLCNCNVKNLSPLGQLKNLTELHLVCNELTSVPEGIKED